VQVQAVTEVHSWRPNYAWVFGTLRSLPHLQVLEVKLKKQATPGSAAVLPGLDAIKALVAPYLTSLNLDVGLPPPEQVAVSLALSCSGALFATT